MPSPTLRAMLPGLLLGLVASTAAASMIAVTVPLSPQDGPPDGPPRAQGDHEPEGRPHRDGQRPEPRVPTDEEWQRTVATLTSHSPTRLQLYSQFEDFMRERARRQASEEGANPDEVDVSTLRPVRMLRARIFRRMDSLWALEEDDPEFYQFSLEQLTAEDDILAAMLKARQAEGTDEEPVANEAVQSALTYYVERILAERQARIDRLAAELVKERELLEHDRSRATELKEKLHERFERQLPPKRERERGPSPSAPRR